MAHDEIRLIGLDLPTRIGVPDSERAQWQSLQADVHVRMPSKAEAMADDLGDTIDYSAVSIRLKALAAERPRRLIETLAAEMASCVLGEFGAAGVVIEVRKRILPGVDYVAFRLERP